MRTRRSPLETSKVSSKASRTREETTPSRVAREEVRQGPSRVAREEVRQGTAHVALEDIRQGPIVDNAPRPLIDRSHDARRSNAFEIVGSWSRTRHSHRSIVSSLSDAAFSTSSPLATPTSLADDRLRGDSSSTTTTTRLPSRSVSIVTTKDDLSVVGPLNLPSDEVPSRRDAPRLGDDESDDVPSPFYLPSQATAVTLAPAGTLKIVLNETETIFLFEMPQETADLDTAEGEAIREDNRKYDEFVAGVGHGRKLANAETQTIRVLVKSRGTQLARPIRRNRGDLVNNWLLHDTYVSRENPNQRSEASRTEKIEDWSVRFVGVDGNDVSPDCDVNCRFRAASLVMERLIANNLYADAHKRYNGLIRRDPCDLNLTFDYELELLWRHECASTRGRPVTCFRWNRASPTLLAASYGPRRDSTTPDDGYLAIWCAKNPSWPGRSYAFDSPIASIDWSRQRPNWLAIGFYDGSLTVLDVSGDPTSAKSRPARRTNGATRSPLWQVQWWSGDEEFADQEQIYAAGQAGRVFRHRASEPDLPGTEIMRVARLEGTIDGVTRTSRRESRNPDVPIGRSPAILLLRRRPSDATIYFVGSSEGCLYRCSVDYPNQQIESFLAHDGPIYSMEFSPFCPKIFLTAGADWCVRIWIEGLQEPLVTLRTSKSCVRSAAWSTANSTVLANVVDDRVCIWDLRSKIHRPASVQVASDDDERLVAVEFSRDGRQLIVADRAGAIRVYDARNVPFPARDQSRVLVEAIERALVARPSVLRKFKTLAGVT